MNGKRKKVDFDTIDPMYAHEKVCDLEYSRQKSAAKSPQDL